MGWLHWLASVVGVLLLGYLWIFLDGVMRHPDPRHRPPIDGTVLCLLVSGLYVTLADPWRHLGPWMVLLFGLPELITPVRGTVAAWRRSAPLRWCLRHPRTHRAFRRLGYREPQVMVTLARWFRPDQLRRLGWNVTAVSNATERMAFVRVEGWDAEAFIRTVRASGRDHTGQLAKWGELHRLGVDDPTEYLRYLAADADIALALQYALGPYRVPYDVVLALERRGDTKLWGLLYALQQEYRIHRTCYRGGWVDIVAWIKYDETPPFAAAPAARSMEWDNETVVRHWRKWTRFSERAPHLEPALWAAAGFTVDEALAMLDAGGKPDAEALRGLAALRRSV